jgi:hypothetical protein
MRRMGRPGLVGTMARTAVVAGTASATAGAVSRHQQQKYAAKDQAAYEQQAAAQQTASAPPPAAPAEPAEDPTVAKIKELGELHSQGLLSDEEFAAAKAKLLGL